MQRRREADCREPAQRDREQQHHQQAQEKDRCGDRQQGQDHDQRIPYLTSVQRCDNPQYHTDDQRKQGGKGRDTQRISKSGRNLIYDRLLCEDRFSEISFQNAFHIGNILLKQRPVQTQLLACQCDLFFCCIHAKHIFHRITRYEPNDHKYDKRNHNQHGNYVQDSFDDII